MRKVDRNKVPEPTILTEPFRGSDETELDKLKAYHHDGTLDKKPAYKRYKETSVKNALKELFLGKCAYCEGYFEDSHPVDVEHYRPKGNVANTEHDGYWWLAADWDNLLPSCIDCNRSRKQELIDIDDPEQLKIIYGERYEEYLDKGRLSMGKKDAFPLEPNSPRAAYIPDDELALKTALEAEERLLIDPTRDDPQQFLSYNLDNNTANNDEVYSLMLPLGKDGQFSQKGLTSSLVYGLNRFGLVKSRTRLLRDLEFLWEMSIQIKSLCEKVDIKLGDPTQDADNREFFGTLNTTLKTIDESIIGKIKEKMKPESPYSSLAVAWYEHKLSSE